MYTYPYFAHIEDICFFEVNTKYISSSELKTSEFSRVRRDEIYLVFTEKKQIFFLFYTMHRHFPMHKVGGENAKTKKKLKTRIIVVPHCSLCSK